VRLQGLVLQLPVADFAAFGVEDEAAQVVEGLAAVELPSDAAAESFVGVPAQRVRGAQQLAVLEQRVGQRVLAGAGLQPGDEQGGRDVPVEQ
jgi:hypothetical protein